MSHERDDYTDRELDHHWSDSPDVRLAMVTAVLVAACAAFLVHW